MSSKQGYVNTFLSWTAFRYIWLNLSGTWTKARAKWENNAGTWRCVQAAIDIGENAGQGSASAAAPSGTVSGGLVGALSVTDSVGSLTYAWTHILTSSGNTPTIIGPATANPSWDATVTDGTPSVSIWRITVTDGTTGAVTFEDVTVTLTFTNSS